MPRHDSVSTQWIVIGAILAGAVYTQTSLRVLLYLPLDLYYTIAATPPMWGPLAGLLILMIGAVLLEGSRRSTRPHWLPWVVAGVAGCLGIIWFFAPAIWTGTPAVTGKRNGPTTRQCAKACATANCRGF